MRLDHLLSKEKEKVNRKVGEVQISPMGKPTRSLFIIYKMKVLYITNKVTFNCQSEALGIKTLFIFQCTLNSTLKTKE